MKVFIDREPFYPSSPTVSRSKKRLIAEIEEEISKKGLTYTAITVDGVEIDYSAFLRLRKGREAHIKTYQIKTLVFESLQEAENYLPRFTDGVQQIASEFERNDQENIEEKMLNFAEGIGWLVNIMQKNQLLLKVEDSELPDKEETMLKLNTTLEKITECFHKGSIMEIAFHMRHGILPEVKNISEYITKLLKIVMHMQ